MESCGFDLGMVCIGYGSLVEDLEMWRAFFDVFSGWGLAWVWIHVWSSFGGEIFC